MVGSSFTKMTKNKFIVFFFKKRQSQVNPPPTSAPPLFTWMARCRDSEWFHTKNVTFGSWLSRKVFPGVSRFFLQFIQKKVLCHQVVHLRFGTMTMVVFTEHQTSPSTTAINVRSTDLWEAECLHGGCMKQIPAQMKTAAMQLASLTPPKPRDVQKGRDRFGIPWSQCPRRLQTAINGVWGNSFSVIFCFPKSDLPTFSLSVGSMCERRGVAWPEWPHECVR